MEGVFISSAVLWLIDEMFVLSAGDSFAVEIGDLAHGFGVAKEVLEVYVDDDRLVREVNRRC